MPTPKKETKKIASAISSLFLVSAFCSFLMNIALGWCGACSAGVFRN
jgi:hypothetical protein